MCLSICTRLIACNDERTSAVIIHMITTYFVHVRAYTDASDMTYQFKTSTAKLALELNDFELAIDLFEHLLEEDDRYVEVWYLTGLAYLNVSNSEDTTTGGSIGDGEKAKVSEHPQADIAIQYLERALQMLEIAPDDEMKGVITDVLEQAKDMQAIQ